MDCCCFRACREALSARRALFTDLGLLLLRLVFGGFMVTHGWGKLTNFSAYSEKFLSLFGMSPAFCLALAIFAEFGCALLLVAGALTRLATLPLIFTMGVAAFVAHGADPFQKKELALAYLGAYVAILLLGPGRFALDTLCCRCCRKDDAKPA